MATSQRILTGDNTTWTVVGSDHRLVKPVERYLEFLRATGCSPNTIKAYARGLALWWTFLEDRAQSWEAVGVADIGAFAHEVRQRHNRDQVAESTVALRVRSVLSFYRFHAHDGVTVADGLYENIRTRQRGYLPFLEHIARRDGRHRGNIRVRVAKREVPIVTPLQALALRDTEATYDVTTSSWVGDLRYRLLWALLEETGMRLGEALSLQHRDWRTGTGSTAIVVVAGRNDHPHGLRCKSGPRKVHIGSDLDRLYGDWVWALCEMGADVEIDNWDNAYVFCNVTRGTRFAPLRPESVYKHLASSKRRTPQVPTAMTPHWFRHTHATGLLLAGVSMHVVSRRLGHADVQTTIGTYAHVTDDAELAACADWQGVTRAWGVAP